MEELTTPQILDLSKAHVSTIIRVAIKLKHLKRGCVKALKEIAGEVSRIVTTLAVRVECGGEVARLSSRNESPGSGPEWSGDVNAGGSG